MAEFTDQERTALKQFRQRIEKLLPEMREEQTQDYNLMRWLRARELNLDKAEAMLRQVSLRYENLCDKICVVDELVKKFQSLKVMTSMVQNLEWRKKNDMDNILPWRAPEEFKQYFPFQICGKDKEGSYVFISPIGKWDIRKVIELGYETELKKGTMHYLEMVAGFARHATEETGKPVTQYIQITDMEDYSMSQLLSSKVRESNIDTMKIMEANYPEQLKKGIVINAPKVFALLFNLIKPFMSAHTISKIEIFDSNREKWGKVLLDLLHPDDLPSNYGGANTSCSNYDFDEGFKLPPRPPTFPADQLKSVTIKPGSAHKVEIAVDKPGTMLSWNFRTDDYDVGFKFFHENTLIYKVNKCDSHSLTQKGFHACKEAGKYTLLFDNTSSKVQAKTLYYHVDSRQGSRTEFQE